MEVHPHLRSRCVSCALWLCSAGPYFRLTHQDSPCHAKNRTREGTHTSFEATISANALSAAFCSVTSPYIASVHPSRVPCSPIKLLLDCLVATRISLGMAKYCPLSIPASSLCLIIASVDGASPYVYTPLSGQYHVMTVINFPLLSKPFEDLARSRTSRLVEIVVFLLVSPGERGRAMVR